jgi:hypothetical protein
MPTPLTDNLRRVLSVIPDEGQIHTRDIYLRLGRGQGVGGFLKALAQRGLIVKVDQFTWQRTSSASVDDRG